MNQVLAAEADGTLLGFLAERIGSGLRRNHLHDRGRHLFESLDIGPLGVGEWPALLYGARIRAGPGRLSDIEGGV